MRSLLVFALAALSVAKPTFSSRNEILSRQSSTNETAVNPRATWGQYDLNTNYYETMPETRVVREYFFNVTNNTASPDGRPRNALLVNGELPGPTIIADWGDTVVVHVTNSLQNNGSSIHFHGIRQYKSNQMDGVQSITQCPIAPGSSYTYTWRAEQYGTSWWHAHYSLQAWEGVFGGILINGPATADYDEDLGHMFLNDWDLETADQQYYHQITTPGITHMDSGLLNGTNEFQYENGTTVGKRLVTNLTPGKKYRLRLVCAALHTHFKFSVDNHKMTVIANDLVPIVPFETEFVSITMGQRYDVIIEATQPVDNYWMRAVPQSVCSNHTEPGNIKGILRYEGAPEATPNTTKWNYGDDKQCFDMPAKDLKPWLALNASIDDASFILDNLTVTENGSPTPIFLWAMGEAPLEVHWDSPTLKQVSHKGTAGNWTAGQNVVELNEENKWHVFIIQNNLGIAHPMHLHGHDFWVLAEGLGVYDPRNVTLNTFNPPRRDTANLDTDPDQNGTGYLVIAFPADNPGAWLMHCHIGFHTPEGFGIQMLELQDQIPALLNQTVMNDTCSAWDSYRSVNSYGIQDLQYNGPWDSGV